MLSEAKISRASSTQEISPQKTCDESSERIFCSTSASGSDVKAIRPLNFVPSTRGIFGMKTESLSLLAPETQVLPLTKENLEILNSEAQTTLGGESTTEPVQGEASSALEVSNLGMAKAGLIDSDYESKIRVVSASLGKKEPLENASNRHPHVYWTQIKKKIFLKLALSNVKEYKYVFSCSAFKFV